MRYASTVVYCTGPGLPVGCVVRPVDRGAPGVGVSPGAGACAPGTGMMRGEGPADGEVNRGGPQNRAGRR
jgi:hypothetical protein